MRLKLLIRTNLVLSVYCVTQQLYDCHISEESIANFILYVVELYVTKPCKYRVIFTWYFFLNQRQLTPILFNKIFV
jgi:hypothetical protein